MKGVPDYVMDQTWCYWLAGIMDACGTVSTTEDGLITVTVEHRDNALLERLADVAGCGTVRACNDGASHWTANGQPAALLLTFILGVLRTTKPHALAALLATAA